MSKMAELSAELEDLQKCGERIVDIAKYLQSVFSSSQDCNTEKNENTSALKPSLENIRDLMKGFSGKGYAEEMKKILQKHGSNNLTNLSPDEYENVMKDLEVFADAT